MTDVRLTANDRRAAIRARKRAGTIARRGFPDLGEALAGTAFRLGPQDRFTEDRAISADLVDRWSFAPEVRIPAIDLDADGGVGVDPMHLAAVVIVDDPALKLSTAAVRTPVRSLPATLAIPDPAALATWTAGTTVHVAIVLADQLEPFPGKPWRKGTWLAREAFKIVDGEPETVVAGSSAIEERTGTTYPVLLQEDAAAVLRSGASNLRAMADQRTVTRGQGTVFDETPVLRMRNALMSRKGEVEDYPSKRDHDWEAFEIPASEDVHRALAPLDRRVLADLDFWTWLACARAGDIVDWRYGAEDGEHADHPNFGVGNRTENLLYRLWIRAEIGFTPDEADPYAFMRVPGRDLWRSHIFRQSYARSRPVARALLRLQSGALAPFAPLDRDGIRDLAKALANVRRDAFLSLLTDEEANRLVVNLIAQPTPSPPRR